jgi:riboflavin kinase/FMN adenylyltransferase
MEVIFENNLPKTFQSFDPSVVTIGSFDGLHLGHIAILNQVHLIAKEENLKSILITFWPHPRQIIDKEYNAPKLLNTFDEKVEIITQSGLIEYLYVIPFDKDLAELDYLQFAEKFFVNRLNAKVILMGYDHRFGKNRDGSFDKLSQMQLKFGFRLIQIPAQKIDEVNISSTKIRNFLNNGDIINANRFLGYFYPLTGRVVKGNQLGRTIGFPTANIEVIETEKLIPSDGVYAVIVHINQKSYKGMMNIGFRPTINGQHKTLEVNILDFNEDIYTKKIVLKFVQKIRNELKFASINDLKHQLSLDKQIVNDVLKEFI